MFDFLLATSNQHKVVEINSILGNQASFKVNAPPASLPVEESGTSYFENAYLKAKAYFSEFGKPSLADDSGLNINSLPNELGIHTARFGGDIPQDERNALVLSKLNSVTQRNASFTCVLCFVISEREHYFFEGHLKGFIGLNAQGDKGFGYDPIFCPEQMPVKTLAELGDWKDLNSHRARALLAANEFFKNF